MVDELRNEVLLVCEPGMSAIVRPLVRKVLPVDCTFVTAEDMETAGVLLQEHLPRLRLVVMGLLLPRDPAAVEELKEVMSRREVAHDAWLEVGGLSNRHP